MNCARAHARNMTLPRRPIPCRSARLSFRRRCISETAVSVVERATDDSPSFSFGAETIRRFSQLAMTQTRSSDSGRSLQLKPDVAAYRVYLSVCRRFFFVSAAAAAAASVIKPKSVVVGLRLTSCRESIGMNGRVSATALPFPGTQRRYRTPH